jgi:hypothetical protein
VADGMAERLMELRRRAAELEERVMLAPPLDSAVECSGEVGLGGGGVGGWGGGGGGGVVSMMRCT